MNHYHIYKAIGQGKYSTVYKGRKKKSIEYFSIKSVDKSHKSKVLQEVRILHSLDHPNVLKSKLNNYDDVVERVAAHLSLDDPSKIRITSHNCYSQQPKPQPINYRGVEHLSDMLAHYDQGIQGVGSVGGFIVFVQTVGSVYGFLVTTVNPMTTPTTNPGGQPTGNPVTTPSAGNAPVGRGQSWCIAKNGASQAALQSALDYACVIGGADCVTIQQGSSCYEPATIQNHASYAFNSYYQKNPVLTSCDFGGAATVTTTNPSTGSCVYPSSSSSSTTPTTPSTAPTTPSTTPTTALTTTTPTTQAPYNPTTLPAPATSSQGSTMPGIQSPTPGFSIGNNDPTGLGAFGASPPLMNSASTSNNLQPFIELLMILPIILKVLIFV